MSTAGGASASSSGQATITTSTFTRPDGSSIKTTETAHPDGTVVTLRESFDAAGRPIESVEETSIPPAAAAAASSSSSAGGAGGAPGPVPAPVRPGGPYVPSQQDIVYVPGDHHRQSASSTPTPSYGGISEHAPPGGDGTLDGGSVAHTSDGASVAATSAAVGGGGGGGGGGSTVYGDGSTFHGSTVHGCEVEEGEGQSVNGAAAKQDEEGGKAASKPPFWNRRRKIIFAGGFALVVVGAGAGVGAWAAARDNKGGSSSTAAASSASSSSASFDGGTFDLDAACEAATEGEYTLCFAGGDCDDSEEGQCDCDVRLDFRGETLGNCRDCKVCASGGDDDNDHNEYAFDCSDLLDADDAGVDDGGFDPVRVCPAGPPVVAPQPTTSDASASPVSSPAGSPTSSDASASPRRSPTRRPTPGPPPSPVARSPTVRPTPRPTDEPTRRPTPSPTLRPTSRPTPFPTGRPTTPSPTDRPTTSRPTADPTSSPTGRPTTPRPSANPTSRPTSSPTVPPTPRPTSDPTFRPTADPTAYPTPRPTIECDDNDDCFGKGPGVCVNDLCLDRYVSSGGTCDDDGDCLNGACAPPSLLSPKTDKVCCPSGDHEYVYSPFSRNACTGQDDGRPCGTRDSLCTSGVCIGGYCAPGKQPANGPCDSDADCEGGKCALDSADRNKDDRICCPTGDAEYLYSPISKSVCTGQEAGQRCGKNNDVCASGVCVGGVCGEGRQPVGAFCTDNTNCDGAGVCVTNTCLETFVPPGGTCDDDRDCVNDACAIASLTDGTGQKVCCLSGDHEYVYSPHSKHVCTGQPVDEVCGTIDDLCSSGVCLNGKCASGRQPPGAGCDSDPDCTDDECAYESADNGASKVCCPTGDSEYLYSPISRAVCTGQGAGRRCGNNNDVCASGVCVAGTCK